MECLEKQSLLAHGANDRTGEVQNAAFRAANNGTPLLAPRHDYELRRGYTQRVSPIVS
jgi:hypothetical protein